MQQSIPCVANWFSASQQFPHVLWNPKVLYRIHKCSPHVPNLRQTNPVHTHKPQFLTVHLNILAPELFSNFSTSCI